MVFLQIILGHISGRNLWCSASFPPTAGQQVLLSSNPEKITHKTRQQRCQCEATAPTVTTVTNAAPVLTLKLKDKKEDGLETPWRRPRNGLETAWRHPGDGLEMAWKRPGDTLEAGAVGPGRRSPLLQAGWAGAAGQLITASRWPRPQARLPQPA